MAQTERAIHVEGGYNIRDLGGYPTEDGQVTRWRSLIRSGNLHQITPAGQDILVQYGLKTVIDLRDEVEVEHSPDVFAQSAAVRYLHLPLSPTNFHVNLAYTRLDELYCEYLRSLQANIGAIIAAIAESEPGILFHCHAGKDRTGMVSALLLGAVGVPVDSIVDDYVETTTHIAHLVAEWRAAAIQNGYDMERFERDVSARAETIQVTLDVLRDEFGGSESYLRLCGITDQQIERLHAHLIG